MYKILRRILFFLPAETAHYFSMNILKALCAVGFIRKIIANQCTDRNAALSKNVLGLNFKNPVGLGAGFDKNAKYLRELEALGFGFVEIGTVTPRPHAGNDKPRLFRLPPDQALINRMGFNNDGVDVVTKRLKKWREKDGKWRMTDDRKNLLSSIIHQPSSLIVGGNIGKNKTTPNEDAWKDYEICFRALHPYVDFFVVNVSSPNTPGLRELQEKDSLRKILTHLQQLNLAFPQQKPILLKIAPDLTWPQIDDVIDLAKEIQLDGLVATNTTISREQLQTTHHELQTIGAGGLSGQPLQEPSTKIVEYISKKTGGTLPVIGSGGIFTGTDAVQKFSAGAALIEVWTGFIYEGPFIVKRICKALY
ncbi:MAG TPA: quinone-dependent dihydroorotate dehydrogenase [Flavisolibacter sp.]|nr:quinone-dependent dihydroorotate dehydrogenase [Flavisolibacter sp.]